MSLVFGLSTVTGFLIGVAVIAVLALLFGVGIYNSLVTVAAIATRTPSSQIDVQLKRPLT